MSVISQVAWLTRGGTIRCEIVVREVTAYKSIDFKYSFLTCELTVLALQNQNSHFVMGGENEKKRANYWIAICAK